MGNLLGSRNVEVAVDTFGFKLLANLTRGKQNVVLSPISIASALAMAACAATDGSATEKQLDAALGARFSDDSVLASYDATVKSLCAADKGVELLLATSVWCRASPLPAFTARMKAFAADARSLTDAATVNAWVAEKTKDKIKNLVESVDDTFCLLISAVYFKGEWSKKFNAENTQAGKFSAYSPNGELVEVDCQMMSTRDKQMLITERDDCTCVALSYGESGRFLACIVLPEETGMDAFVAGMSAPKWEAMLASLAPQDVKLDLPRFKLEFEVSLVDPLKALGLVAMFGETGQLMNLASDPSLFVTEALHKAVLEVNEEGTVAAAATSVAVGRSFTMPKQVTVDRPFIFAVYDKTTKLILFIGRADNPKFV